MIARVLLVAALLIGGGWAAPASAKPGDKAWAACVWQTAPASAAQWLTMKPADWQESFESPSSLLGLRLSALCGTPAAVELKPNRYYNFKQFFAALKAVRPAAPSPADRDDARVELCRFQLDADGKPTTFRYDVVRVDAAARITTFQQYYGSVGGQSLRLPQDLRILPKPDQAVKTICNAITSQGTLADA